MKLKNYNNKAAMGVIAFILLLPSYGSTQTKDNMAERQSTPQAKEISDNDTGTLKNFVFTDAAGRSVKLSDFKGKWIFVDVWYSGCGGCITANKGIKIAHEALVGEDIIFLSISIDTSRDRWVSSITPGAKKTEINPWAGKYVPARGTIILNTSGTGSDNEFRKYYVPKNTYPKLLLFDRDGILIEETPPRQDIEPEKLVSFIKKYLEDIK